MATEQTVSAVIRATRPSFRTSEDKAAFVVHAVFVAAGYVLHATGPPALHDDALTSSTRDEVGMDNWNDIEDNYAFVYSNPEKGSKKVLVKCLVMNSKLFVNVLEEGDSDPLDHELDVNEYVKGNGGTNYMEHYKNLGKLVDELNKKILQKLSVSVDAASSSQPSRDVTSSDGRDRTGVHIHEDPYSDAPRTSGYVVPPVPSFGYDDAFPGPGAGMYPGGGFGGSGGMLIGPNDPRFGFRDPGGLPGVSPPGGPPGARFDPYGPPGVPGFEPGRFTRDPRRPRGGNHPDLEPFPGGGDFI